MGNNVLPFNKSSISLRVDHKGVLKLETYGPATLDLRVSGLGRPTSWCMMEVTKAKRLMNDDLATKGVIITVDPNSFVANYLLREVPAWTIVKILFRKLPLTLKRAYTSLTANKSTSLRTPQS